MENSVNVAGLKKHFETIVNRTLLAYDLRNCYDAADKETLRVIEQDVRHMERALTELKKVIASGRLELDEMHAQTRDTRALADSVRHMLENVPESLPRDAVEKPKAREELRDGDIPLRTTSDSGSRPECAKENVAPTGGGGQNKGIAPPTKPSSIAPLIPPLTMDEYDDTPKYMLGRITYASLNKTIQDINLTMAEKYRLMKKKQKDKSPQEIRLVQAFKKQENSETQGVCFVVAEDLKLLGVSTDGFNSRQFATHLPILRHHRRLREIRGGGFTRLTVC